MTTQIQKRKTSPEKGWEIKDRVYILTQNRSPISWTIQSKHTLRKPLFWFDENTGENKEIRYATNQKSLFVGDQEGYVTLGHVIFLDGVLEVSRQQQALQKLLSIYHPQAGTLWEEIDEVAEASDEVEDLELELEALNLVKTLDIEHLEAIMRTELGSTVTDLSSKELKRDAYRFAQSDPKLFHKAVFISSGFPLFNPKDRYLKKTFEQFVSSQLLKLPPIEFLKWWYNLPIYNTLKDYSNFLGYLSKKKSSFDSISNFNICDS